MGLGEAHLFELVLVEPEEVADLVEQRHAHFVGDRVWELDTGHDLMITEPEKTAELLLRLADLGPAGR